MNRSKIFKQYNRLLDNRETTDTDFRAGRSSTSRNNKMQ